MTDREKLELAAKALGIRLNFSGCASWIAAEFGQSVKFWNPLTDQADSDAMACKLRIETKFHKCVTWSGDARIPTWFSIAQIGELYTSGHIRKAIEHNNTDEDVCRAVREARLLVAAEIGRLK